MKYESLVFPNAWGGFGQVYGLYTGALAIHFGNTKLLQWHADREILSLAPQIGYNRLSTRNNNLFFFPPDKGLGVGAV